MQCAQVALIRHEYDGRMEHAQHVRTAAVYRMCDTSVYRCIYLSRTVWKLAAIAHGLLLVAASFAYTRGR
eukprot:7652942-Heterocapsa_arctica.AAC.1